MATFSWQIVEDVFGDVVTVGTGTVRDTVTGDDMAADIRVRYPNAVEVAVWAGKPTDRPAQVRDPRQVA